MAEYQQTQEADEYRYFSPQWLEDMAAGLTAGHKKHPQETWQQIPAKEHAWRAVRHLVKYINEDTSDNHLLNASMRVMFAYTIAQRQKKDRFEIEKNT